MQLPGPAGALEALLSPVPDGITPKRAVLLCHPHPLYGGTMHNKVLYRIARRLPVEAGALVGLGLPLSLAMDFAKLREIRVPLLLVQGQKDEFADEAAVRRFAKGLPRPPTLHFVPKAGHLFHGMENAAVDAVVRFLNKN